MILTLDIGNTRIKAAVFEQDTTLVYFILENENILKQIENILETYPKCHQIVVASVGNFQKEAFQSLQNRVNIHFITHQNAFPFTNQYATPQTLGIDRMVLAAGAVLQFPNQNRLIIDAGTCITYDYVDDTNNYFGGAISPGFRLRFESLHQHTSKLPLIRLEPIDYLIGDSTSNSILSGVVNGVCFEIDGFINEFKKTNSNFIIILTGGDAEFLANRLKNTIFADCNFLLNSLNKTFQYQIQYDS
jgi:type III pantothenate kinase